MGGGAGVQEGPLGLCISPGTNDLCFRIEMAGNPQGKSCAFKIDRLSSEKGCAQAFKIDRA